MKLSNMAVAIAVALGSASAFAAGPGPLDLSNGTAGFDNTPLGAFSDVYTFSALAPFTLTSSITSVVNGARNLNFSSIRLTSGSSTYNFVQTLPDPFELWTYQSGTLPSGSYQLTLVGMNSVLPASYGGNVSIMVVPEPESYALMLAGLGAVGFLATRRKNRV